MTTSLPDHQQSRPGKIFTANRDVIISTAAELTPDGLKKVTDAMVNLLRRD